MNPAPVELVLDLRARLEAARAGRAFDPVAALEILRRVDRALRLLQVVSLNGVEQFEHHVQDLSLVSRISEVFALAFDVDRTCQALLEVVLEAIPCENAVLYLARSDLGVRFAGVAGPTPAADDFEVAERVAWMTMNELSMTRVDDVHADDRFQGTMQRSRARSLVGCPMQWMEETLGAMVLTDPSPGAFSQEGTQILGAVADLSAAAISHARVCVEKIDHQRDLERLVQARTREVNEARAALSRQERTAALGKLAASIAHEVNNPMSYLISNLQQAIQYSRDVQASLPVLLELLESVLRLPASSDARVEQARAIAARAWYATLGDGLTVGAAEFAELLAEAKEGALRVQRVGEDLRGFAQGIAGIVEPVNLNGLLEMALQVVEADAKGRVEFELRAGLLPEVRCRRYEITQVLIALLQNAVEATEEVGTVRVTSREVGRHVEVEIADEGLGIPPERIDGIFEPFITTKIGGGGLGLTIARDIVESHGGAIHVQSSPEGSVFTLRLVAAGPDEPRRG